MGDGAGARVHDRLHGLVVVAVHPVAHLVPRGREGRQQALGGALVFAVEDLGCKGSRVRGFEGSRVRGFEGSRVQGFEGLCEGFMGF